MTAPSPACRDHPTLPPDAWFAVDAATVRAAVRVCASCPLRLACATAGQGEGYGVWGGVPRDPAQIDALARAVRRAPIRSRA